MARGPRPTARPCAGESVRPLTRVSGLTRALFDRDEELVAQLDEEAGRLADDALPCSQ